MKIAIIGAGFSGIATAYLLLKKLADHSPALTLFDAKGIGAGASGIAAGLLHPFVGAHSKLNQFGREGFQATMELLKVSEKHLDKKVFAESGYYRVATDDQQVADFKKNADIHADIQKVDFSKLPGVIGKEVYCVTSAVTVDTLSYLTGLWLACEKMGGHFKQEKVIELDSLIEFDLIVVAVGADVGSIEETKGIKITRVKGQLVELEWPKGLKELPAPITSHSYLVMNPANHSCYLGATYERNFASEEPDSEQAMKELIPKAMNYYPAIQQLKLVGCFAGVRASSPDRMPIIKQLSAKAWAISGMGSRGLLYHALYAERLVERILT